MSPGLPILYICAVGGFGLALGCIWLLLKQKASLNRSSKEATEIELPGGLKIKSSTPMIVLIFIGAGLMMFASLEARKFGEEVTVDGTVSGGGTSIELYASVASQSLPRGGQFSLPLPVTHPQRKYTLLYAVDGVLVSHQIVDPASAPSKALEPIKLEALQSPRLVGEIDPVPPGY